MMDLDKIIVGDLLEKQLCSMDRIIEEAFMEHFGFPSRMSKTGRIWNT